MTDSEFLSRFSETTLVVRVLVSSVTHKPESWETLLSGVRVTSTPTTAVRIEGSDNFIVSMVMCPSFLFCQVGLPNYCKKTYGGSYTSWLRKEFYWKSFWLSKFLFLVLFVGFQPRVPFLSAKFYTCRVSRYSRVTKVLCCHPTGSFPRLLFSRTSNNQSDF